jgi:hypothetical protein
MPVLSEGIKVIKFNKPSDAALELHGYKFIPDNHCTWISITICLKVDIIRLSAIQRGK